MSENSNRKKNLQIHDSFKNLISVKITKVNLPLPKKNGSDGIIEKKIFYTNHP